MARLYTPGGCPEHTAPAKTPNMDAGIPRGYAHIPDVWRREVGGAWGYKSSHACFLSVAGTRVQGTLELLCTAGTSTGKNRNREHAPAQPIRWTTLKPEFRTGL